MQFLKDVETPRNTCGTFSSDEDEGTVLGQLEDDKTEEDKSDSYEDQENEGNCVNVETARISVEDMEALSPHIDAEIKSTTNSPVTEFNISKLGGRKKKEKTTG